MEDDSNGNKPELPKDVIIYHYDETPLSKEIMEMINSIFSTAGIPVMDQIDFVDKPLYKDNVVRVDFTKKKERE